MPEQATTWNRWRREPLAIAVCASLLLHGLFWGAWHAGREHGWWEVSVPFLDRLLARFNAAIVNEEEIAKALERQQQRLAEELPLMFMDVSAAQASTEAPETPKFYGAVNSIAANAEAADTEAETPKLDGEQTDIPKAVDVTENRVQPAVAPAAAQPGADQEVVADANTAPVPEAEQLAQGKPDAPPTPVAELQATEPGTPDQLQLPAPPTLKPGDLAMAPTRTQPERGDGAPPKGDEGTAKVTRPRTIAQARALQPQDLSIAGQQMKLDGGVRNQRAVPSFDTQGTPWGSYDAKLIATIQSQWYRFLDQHPEAFNWAGRVVTKFVLHHDGRITDFEFVENSAGEIQGYGCQKAIVRDLGQPYDPWPPQLRRITDKDYRELRFTFYYH
ncbi:MAG TPA: hypothetical protein DCY13_21850 [Verrucomicrobiales bacterium]|nr:hypothetical protein [Verrucomicrobiales bacterium]